MKSHLRYWILIIKEGVPLVLYRNGLHAITYTLLEDLIDKKIFQRLYVSLRLRDLKMPMVAGKDIVLNAKCF